MPEFPGSISKGPIPPDGRSGTGTQRAPSSVRLNNPLVTVPAYNVRVLESSASLRIEEGRVPFKIRHVAPPSSLSTGGQVQERVAYSVLGVFGSIVRSTIGGGNEPPARSGGAFSWLQLAPASTLLNISAEQHTKRPFSENVFWLTA